MPKEKSKPDELKEKQEPVEEAAAEEQAPDEVQQLQTENEELKNKVLRQMAEFDNFRKRTIKEKEDLTFFVKSGCAEPLILLMDNFERALQCESSDENFKKGVEMLFEQFKSSLSGLGIQEIDCVGKPFDPNYHNAVNQVQDENFGENTVCQVLQKGYQLGDKVVRHAMVVVANP